MEKQKDFKKIEEKMDYMISILKDLLVVELRREGKKEGDIRRVVKINNNRIYLLTKGKKQEKK